MKKSNVLSLSLIALIIMGTWLFSAGLVKEANAKTRSVDSVVYESRDSVSVKNDLTQSPLFVTDPSCSGSLIYDGIVYNLIEVDLIGGGSSCWLDKNLGASIACDYATNPNCYGDLYQWGRLNDGHQQKDSPITNVLSSTDVPGHSSYILGSKLPFDWRSPQNNKLWDDSNSDLEKAILNNPCPHGFKVPNVDELQKEISSWSYMYPPGPFNSQLKWPLSGQRVFGAVQEEGTAGYVWSSVDNLDQAYAFRWDQNGVTAANGNREHGMPVRCIRR